MRTLYSFLTHISVFFLWVSGLFNKKMRLFVKGRKKVLDTIAQRIKPEDKTIWFHCASLGEFEQGLPIMQAIKTSYPQYKLVLTFFSPSGYEIKKNSPVADLITYLPLDTRGNAKRFVSLVHPSLAIFVKYEFWPNYLFELESSGTPAIIVSGLFRENQSFFRPYGVFMRKALRTIDHFFVQNKNSEMLLKGLGIDHVNISGDTRFDRVSAQIEQDNSLPFIEAFKGNSICIVCGSTWPEDEAILIPYINAASANIKFIVAPHTIEAGKIDIFRKKIKGTSILYSEKDSADLSAASVLIIDNIGLLTKVYHYADIAYVGGAMGNSGLHNILEPATFGIPVVIGKNFEKFPEAKRLQSLAALFSVSNQEEVFEIMSRLVDDKNFREKTGMIAGHFVNSNTGATRVIMEYIASLHSNGLI
ncbi:3-deoxy-D-manno-octulosonic acid transferase [Pukyongia salina]|uniref:3-deoxy-D-manno-octulosonic acid transferase n=1 Tax=Pukyongia salina TaxID=2094025 RepID=A0A2S0HUB8_9FLAO|nr:glycosyltransferase N-terminal domain-containing protein [Pukyongia salina]AVI50230.1 3-deoxy-D-manno-octulosonic acid transferase [Pukyongia salina]